MLDSEKKQCDIQLSSVISTTIGYNSIINNFSNNRIVQLKGNTCIWQQGYSSKLPIPTIRKGGTQWKQIGWKEGKRRNLLSM
jgi:hypothetical protein